MTILIAGSGWSKFIFLPMRFCAPKRTLAGFPGDFAHHFYLASPRAILRIFCELLFNRILQKKVMEKNGCALA